MMMDPSYYGGFNMGGGSVMMMLVFLGIGILFYMLFMNTNIKPKSNYEISYEALSIAEKRLAHGEITLDEFYQIKKSLLG